MRTLKFHPTLSWAKSMSFAKVSRRNKYYYNDLVKFLRFNIPDKSNLDFKLVSEQVLPYMANSLLS